MKRVVESTPIVRESPEGSLEKAVRAVREAFDDSEERAYLSKQKRFRPVTLGLEPPSGLEVGYCGVRVLKFKGGAVRLGWYDPEIKSWVIASTRKPCVPIEVWGTFSGTLVDHE